MASFESVLQVKGKEYNVLYSDFDIHQYTDSLGRPASPTFGGVYTLDIEAPPSGDSTLFEWMVEPALFLNGQVLIKNLSSRTNLKVIKFYNAYCVDLEQHFDGTGLSGGERSLRLSLRVSPQAVNINGQMHDNDWPAPEPIVDWDWTEMDAACHPERQIKEEPSALSEGLHTLLDVVGMIPIVGEIADGANALLYAAEGNYTDAALSAAAMIPLAGNVVGAAKLGRRALKVADNLGDASKLVGKALNKAEKGLDAVKGPLSKLRKTCGDPVDIASGDVIVNAVDFSLPGPIPLVWERTWQSSATRQGTIGHGWSHPYDWAIIAIAQDGTVGIRDGEGRLVAFEAPQAGGKGQQSERLALFLDTAGVYRLWHMDELRWYSFGVAKIGQERPQPLQTVEDPNGFTLRFTYDSLGHLLAITDSVGRELRIDVDSQGLLRAVHSPDTVDVPSFPLVQYGYDDLGNLISTTDAEGHTARYYYKGYQLIQRTARNGSSWYFKYESETADARCVHTWGEEGLLNNRLSYDNGTQTTVLDSYQQATVYTHQNGIVTRQLDALGAEQRWMYSDADQLIAYQDPTGATTQYDYDDWGNLVSVKSPDGTTVHNRYNERGLLSEVVDAQGGRWQWSYDERGNLLVRVDPMGAQTFYEPDEQGRLVGFTDALEQTVRLRYDEHHNLAHVITPDNQIRSYSYNSLGQLITVTDPLGNKQHRQHDKLGQLVSVREANSSVRELVYNPSGQVISVKQGDQVVEFGYTALGQLAQRYQAGKRILFDYDQEGRLTALINEAGFRYQFTLDSVGQVIEETGFDGLSRHYERDPAGRITKIVRASGRSTEYQYTSAGYTRSIQHSDGAKELFEYDELGNLISAENSSSKVQFKRDALGRIIREEQGNYWIEYSYDSLGQRTGITSSLGAKIDLHRDRRGNISTMQAGSWKAKFDYDQQGLEVQRTLSGNVRVGWRRDNFGRLTHQLIGDARQRHYHWQVDGPLKQLEDSKFGKSLFEHDPLGTLIRAEYADGTEELRFPDAVGNLFETAQRNDRQYGQSGQLLLSRQAAYQYDNDGNLTRKTTHQGEDWRYEWSDNSTLNRVIRPDGQLVTFTYDALGRRISKQFKSKTTHWVWEGDKPLHEWTELSLTGNNTEEIITWLFEEDSLKPIGKLQGLSRYSIITDHLGTPLEMVDQQGSQRWSAEVTSYGRIRMEEGTRHDCPFRYQGQYEDTETGLYYNRFRYYDPEQGGYISQDPIGLLGGYALYGYVIDPTSYVDPFGLHAVFDEALANIAQAAHNVLKANPRNFKNSTVSVAEAILPDGTKQLYAAGNAATLSPAQRKVLEDLGIPKDNIFSGKRFYETIKNADGAVNAMATKAANHAERVIINNAPKGAKFTKWGVSWGGRQLNASCEKCIPHVNAASVIDVCPG